MSDWSCIDDHGEDAAGGIMVMKMVMKMGRLLRLDTTNFIS